MRAKLRNRIYLCTVVTHTENSNLILLTTSNGVYTVEMSSTEDAVNCHMSMLENGYYDFTNRRYRN
jgi:hypothetical protein